MVFNPKSPRTSTVEAEGEEGRSPVPGMKPRVSPCSHPLDQFRRDHPFLEKQGQNVGSSSATRSISSFFAHQRPREVTGRFSCLAISRKISREIDSYASPTCWSNVASICLRTYPSLPSSSRPQFGRTESPRVQLETPSFERMWSWTASRPGRTESFHPLDSSK
jgi:hypothetical protein